MEKLIADCHTHSDLSFDGDNSPEEMVKAAVSRGIKHLAITDHVEIDCFDDPEYSFPKTVTEAAKLLPALKNRYNGEIDLIWGVELGQPLHNIELTTRLLAENDYDFIIGSCHAVRGYKDFYFLDYSEADPEKILEQYFEEMLEMAQWGGFDVLGHLTYPLRYISGEHGIKIDMARFNGIIEEIFKTIIKNGMGIEINTSGLREKIGVTLPDIEYIKLYRRLGGEIITVGSDAHSTTNLGSGIAAGIALAKEAGFGKIWYYSKRQPKCIEI